VQGRSLKLQLILFLAILANATLQFFSIGLAHFLKQKLHSQNNMGKPPNYLAIVHNRTEFLIQFIKLQMPKYMSQCLSTLLHMIRYRFSTISKWI